MHPLIESYYPTVLKYRFHIIAISAALILSSLWFVPPVRTAAKHGYNRSLSLVGSSSPTPISLPSPSELERDQERITEIETQVSATQKELIAVKQSLIDNHVQLKAVLSEIAQTNDMLEKRQNEWLSALKKMTPVTVSGGSNTPKSSSSSSTTPTSSLEPEPETGPINLNTASLDQLDDLPGIGATYAQRIIDYREQQGAFKNIADIKNVKGIGEALFEKIKELVEV